MILNNPLDRITTLKEKSYFFGQALNYWLYILKTTFTRYSQHTLKL